MDSCGRLEKLKKLTELCCTLLFVQSSEMLIQDEYNDHDAIEMPSAVAVTRVVDGSLRLVVNGQLADELSCHAAQHELDRWAPSVLWEVCGR